MLLVLDNYHVYVEICTHSLEVYIFGEKHCNMFHANKEFVLYCVVFLYSKLSLIYCFVCVEVLWPSQPMGSCRARSVYLTTLLLDRFNLLSKPYIHSKLTFSTLLANSADW